MTVSAQDYLAGGALVIMGGLAAAMLVFPIPTANATSFTFVLGALAGALTVSGGQKVADKLTTSTGPGAIIQAEGPPK